MKERGYLKRLDIDGKVTLKCIFNKYGGDVV